MAASREPSQAATMFFGTPGTHRPKARPAPGAPLHQHPLASLHVVSFLFEPSSCPSTNEIARAKCTAPRHPPWRHRPAALRTTGPDPAMPSLNSRVMARPADAGSRPTRRCSRSCRWRWHRRESRRRTGPWAPTRPGARAPGTTAAIAARTGPGRVVQVNEDGLKSGCSRKVVRCVLAQEMVVPYASMITLSACVSAARPKVS
jgi:hypothetical protein